MKTQHICDAMPFVPTTMLGVGQIGFVDDARPVGGIPLQHWLRSWCFVIKFAPRLLNWRLLREFGWFRSENCSPNTFKERRILCCQRRGPSLFQFKICILAEFFFLFSASDWWCRVSFPSFSRNVPYCQKGTQCPRCPMAFFTRAEWLIAKHPRDASGIFHEWLAQSTFFVFHVFLCYISRVISWANLLFSYFYILHFAFLFTG